MSDWIFDTPWWLPALLLGAGAALWLSGNKRQERRLMLAGGAAAGVAVLLLLVSYFIDTDKERVAARTDALVRSVNDQDWKKFESLLDPGTHFAMYHNRDELVAGAKKATQDWNVKSVKILHKQVTQTDTLISVDMDTIATVTTFSMEHPVRSSWRLDWQQTGDGWFLDQITPLAIEGRAGDEITKNLRK